MTVEANHFCILTKTHRRVGPKCYSPSAWPLKLGGERDAHCSFECEGRTQRSAENDKPATRKEDCDAARLAIYRANAEEEEQIVGIHGENDKGSFEIYKLLAVADKCTCNKL